MILGQCMQTNGKNSYRDRIKHDVTVKEEYMHAVNHAFEIHYWCLQTTKENHLSKSSTGFGYSDEKLLASDPGGHGAAVLESNFPKSQASWGLLSLL